MTDAQRDYLQNLLSRLRNLGEDHPPLDDGLDIEGASALIEKLTTQAGRLRACTYGGRRFLLRRCGPQRAQIQTILPTWGEEGEAWVDRPDVSEITLVPGAGPTGRYLGPTEQRCQCCGYGVPESGPCPTCRWHEGLSGAAAWEFRNKLKEGAK